MSEGLTEATAAEINHALHRFLRAAKVGRLESWSRLLAGISFLDLGILRMAAERSDVILKEIREKLSVPQSTLTSAVDRLEERKLLRRVISPRDRRSYGLELTREGWRIDEEHKRIDRLSAELIVEALGKGRDVRRFLEMLSKICRRFEETAEQSKEKSYES